jgi:hypothetical protein
MNVIYKEKLSMMTPQVLIMPSGSEILTVGIEKEVLCMWFMFDEKDLNNITERHQFHIYPTGVKFQIPFNHKYVNSVTHEGTIFHIFHGVLE